MKFNSILVNHKITFGVVMKKTPLPPLSLTADGGKQGRR